jgi:hypothetical protein
MIDHPFTEREHATITEVFSGYDLDHALLGRAWRAIVACWHATSGRFYAYAVAHEIAASALLVDSLP